MNQQAVDSGVMVQTLLALLEQLAPLHLSEDWDNVGLLWEPHARHGSSERDERMIGRALLTVDLTEAVLAEALQQRADLILAYHPPIFAGQKRLTLAQPGTRVLLTAAQHGVLIYSPHTALDAVVGGVNDWLLSGLGAGATAAIIPALDPTAAHAGAGMGRLLQLAEPTLLSVMVQRLKTHLGLAHVRVAASAAHERGQLIGTVAVCAGAGGSVLERADRVDLSISGEMRHHDVLKRVAAGHSVILCDHTNTERGYLPQLARRLEELAQGKLTCYVSQCDRDPLQVT